MQAKVIYRQSDGQLSGYTYSNDLSSLSPEYDNGTHATAEATLPAELFDDPSLGRRYFYISGILYKDYHGYIDLTSDKTDTNSDGIEDMTGDGTTVCTYTLQKKTAAGGTMTDAGDNETIALTANRGKLNAMSVDLVNGTATFTLTSVNETCLIDVAVSHTTLGTTKTQLQLIP